ncbi:MAG: PEGA domain-containing protein, partial [Elusimicrobiota bacterium]
TVPAARPAGPPIFIKDVPRPPVPARSLPVLTPSIEQPLVKQPPISSVSADVSPEVQVPRQVRSSSSFPGERIQSNEEKGKTVFEEVGDWLVTRFKLYRRRVIRVTVAFIFAILLFALIDTFIRITPFGRMMYSRLYPPDVIITTVPAGSSVTMKTRDGKVVLSNESSSSPIALRGIAPKTYIITAVKDGFRPVERIVKIEEPDKDTKVRAQQNIEICFDFMLAINSNPGGADIYVDGNKLSVTPWEGQLASGEHTIKLSYPGYIDLGSVAKETKDGQCNIDLTRATMLEMFSGVDQKSWKYSILNSSGVTGYALHAIMAKRINFNSNPIGMMVQLPNETAPRGQTPISIPLTGGDYAVKFFDSANRYAEQTRTVVVSTMSADTVSATLDKWITFSVSARENPHQSFDAKVRIAGKGISLEKELTTGKPLRVALPLETYKVTFFGDYQFKPLTLNSVNIEDRSSVSGQLEYSNPLLRLVAKNDNSGDPVADAYVWMNGDMIGKTSRQGLFEGNVVYGTATVRVVAKGYSENTQEKYLAPGKSYSMTYRLAPEQTVAVSSGTAARPTEEVLPEGPPKKKNIFPETRKPAVIIPTVVETTGTITCANCGKVYPAGQKKLRFCTNCGKPFR